MSDAASPIKSWAQRIEKIISGIHETSSVGPETALNLFAEILSYPPIELSYHVSEFDQEKFANFMRVGAFESAAFLLIGSKVGVMFSRSRSQDSIASVWTMPMTKEISFESPDMSLALLGAYGKTLVHLSLRANQTD
jgi:hypothetical protein